MASLQHIDEPVIGLFYSGPTGYCDSVSVMKESRFRLIFLSQLNGLRSTARAALLLCVATYLFVTVCESFPEDFEDFCLTGTLFPVCWFAISILAFARLRRNSSITNQNSSLFLAPGFSKRVCSRSCGTQSHYDWSSLSNEKPLHC